MTIERGGVPQRRGGKQSALCPSAFVLLILLALASGGAGDDAVLPSQLRRPVAMTLVPERPLLAVANRESGSLSLVDIEGWQVAAELSLGGRPSDVAACDTPGRVLVTDTAHDAVLLVEIDAAGAGTVVDRCEVSPDPVSVTFLGGGRAVVLSRHSRVVTVVETDGDQLASRQRVNLPFEPRLAVWLTDHQRVVVAGAFEAQIAVIDGESWQVESVRRVPGHNVRGLLPSGDGRHLLLAHQHLGRHARSSFADIHWGLLSISVVRTLRLESVLDPEADLLAGSRLDQLGDPGNGAADPGPLAELADGRHVVALGGTGELKFLSPNLLSGPSVAVGSGPRDVIALPSQEAVVVCSTFEDRLILVSTKEPQVLRTVGLGPAPEPGPVERGEELFFSASLSHDRWLSCHSCHTDGETSGLLADTTEDGSFDSPKRIPSLRGTAQTAPWGWTGAFSTLPEQVENSVRNTMQGTHVEDMAPVVADLTAYLESLPPPRSSPDEEKVNLRAAGEQVFQQRGCGRCHVPPTFTVEGVFDVGLEDETGQRKFNPPSLRGVGSRDRFFHDGRGESLEAVFERFQHPAGTRIPSEELPALLEYLRSL